MLTSFSIADLHGEPARKALLELNNRSAQETSLLTRDRFDQLIGTARIALAVGPAAALLLAFEHTDEYDGSHFQWFRGRFDRFVYVDRIIIAEHCRRHGLARILYQDVFKRARALHHSRIVCEVNIDPPNPVSDRFHAAMGFQEVGQATLDNGSKTVRYLSVNL